MFDYNQNTVLAACRYRQSRLLNEAESERLAKIIHGNRPALHHHLLATTGDWLIAAGTTLKARVDPLPASPASRGGEEHVQVNW